MDVAAILLIIVFFAVRRLTREELPLRVAQATMQDLITTDSTNGKVEPQHNFEAHAPAPSTVKHLYVRAGEQVPTGELLLSLDDADAVAHSASAVAVLRGAQASYQATEQGGTLEERNSLAGELAKARMDRDQAQHDLDALQKLVGRGPQPPGEVASAQQRLDAANDSISTLEKKQTARYSPPSSPTPGPISSRRRPPMPLPAPWSPTPTCERHSRHGLFPAGIGVRIRPPGRSAPADGRPHQTSGPCLLRRAGAW